MYNIALTPNDIFRLRYSKPIIGTRIAIGYINLPSIKCKTVSPKQQLKYKPLVCLSIYNCKSKHACKHKTYPARYCFIQYNNVDIWFVKANTATFQQIFH